MKVSVKLDTEELIVITGVEGTMECIEYYHVVEQNIVYKFSKNKILYIIEEEE